MPGYARVPQVGEYIGVDGRLLMVIGYERTSDMGDNDPHGVFTLIVQDGDEEREIEWNA